MSRMSSNRHKQPESRVKNGKFSLTKEGNTLMNSTSNRSSLTLKRPCSKQITLVAVLVCSMLLGACASTGTAKKHPVEERAQQRLDALLLPDFDTAYSLYSPGYRSANSRVDFEISQRVRKIAITQAEVVSSECSADTCTVTAMVGYRVGAAVPGVSKWESATQVQERWVRTDGNWWYVPDN